MRKKKKALTSVSTDNNDIAISPESVPAGNVEHAPKENFPIVGIGASAGGLTAFEAFFSGMPSDTDPGMAFVLVQHLAPDHKSILAELISRYTRMQVYEVQDGMTVRPNCAYIIPPNRDMALLNGTLHLLEIPSPRGMHLPIDIFFRSLAQDQRERAICIVLSGTGSDGTLGLRDIKGEGGMAMAQNPESTEYDSMPRSAIATGLVDFVLPPAEMPAQLIAYVSHAFGKASHPVSHQPPKTEDAFKKIFILLRSHTGHDFSKYKENTINRRIERRMAVHQIQRLSSYVSYLQQTPAEVEALFRDLLIGVTNFFRDLDAFAALETQVIPHLFDRKPASQAIRVWVAGCSTGEEAYSIAILLQERIETLKRSFKIQIFATDIDSRAIAAARSGVYPASIAVDISPERLVRHFDREPDGSAYRVHKSLRDMIVFSEQDVIKDPPFSKLDLISCRNLLIYMGGDLQKKLIPLFHYALTPGAFLFLGTSESVGEFSHLYSTIDRKAKLYQRKEDAPGAYRQGVGKYLSPVTKNAIAPRFSVSAPAGWTLPLRELTERALLQHFSPVGALVNEHGDILYLHGRTGRYLEPAQGEAGFNILKMAREGLRRDLTLSLHKAVTQKEKVLQPGLHVKTNGDYTTVNLTVRPVAASSDAAAGATLYLVVIEEAPMAPLERPETVIPLSEGDTAAVEARIALLSQELRSKDEYLQTTLEEMETSNEELKSSNEEMQAVNEELQSTNEELETSKEELQSVNEELATVNAELQQKVAELSRTNNDMNNLMAGTGIGTIFVDHNLLIQKFTPAVTQVINLILTDIGRPVGHVVSNLGGYDRLVADVQEVLNNLAPKEIEVQTKAGAWYLLRIRPYRTLENMIEGAVITFTEITEMKKAQALLQETETLRRISLVVRDASDAITLQDLDGRILAWNPGAVRTYGWSEAEALNMNIRELIPEGLREEALATVRQLLNSEVLTPYRTQRITKDGRVVDVSLTATALLDEAQKVYALMTTERQILKG